MLEIKCENNMLYYNKKIGKKIEDILNDTDLAYYAGIFKFTSKSSKKNFELRAENIAGSADDWGTFNTINQLVDSLENNPDKYLKSLYAIFKVKYRFLNHSRLELSYGEFKEDMLPCFKSAVNKIKSTLNV